MTIKHFLFLVASALSVQANADDVYHVRSPDHRVAVLELYTSEGCSSCPPADRWLSALRHEAISGEQLVPLAFHVTYWDTLGWKDRFGDTRYDDRQNAIAVYNSSRTIYTPQFVLDGQDYRRGGGFSNEIMKVIAQPAAVDLDLSATLNNNNAHIKLAVDLSHSPSDVIAVYLAVVENNLSSEVSEGENGGETLKHDFVVRKLFGPFILHASDNPVEQDMTLASEWKRGDLRMAAFAQNPRNGEVLQAVSLGLGR